MLEKIFITKRKGRGKRKFAAELFGGDSVSKFVPPPKNYVPEPKIDLNAKEYPVPRSK